MDDDLPTPPTDQPARREPADDAERRAEHRGADSGVSVVTTDSDATDSAKSRDTDPDDGSEQRVVNVVALSEWKEAQHEESHPPAVEPSPPTESLEPPSGETKTQPKRSPSAAEVFAQIKPAVPARRFLQSWDSKGRCLTFGCGDGENGVLVRPPHLFKWKGDPAAIVRTRLSTPMVVRIRKKSKQPVNGPTLFAEVMSVLRAYLYVGDPRLFGLITLWIIGTYVYTIFSHYGYLFLHSRQKRAGKTRTLELLSHFAFDATPPLNAPTPPSVRDLADEGHTALLDTLERSREKNHESHAAMMELLDAGFRNGGTVVKQVKVGGDFRRREYHAYAPYAMAAIKMRSLSDTALDRAFVIEAHRKPIRVKTKRYQFERCDADCAPIRETLYGWALQNGGEIAAHYEGPELDAKMDHLALHDRANDIWRPLFAVASVLGVPEDTMRGLSTLAREMGGDPEAVEDARKLAIVRALRIGATNGHVIGMTSDLTKDIVTRGVPIGDTDLTPLLKIWGFEQRQWRLPGGKTPRRSWCLPDSRLAALERELGRDAGEGHGNTTALIPAEMLTTLTTTRRRAQPRSPGRLHLADLPDADLDLLDGERLASESDDDASGNQEHEEVKSPRRVKSLKTSVKADARPHGKGTNRD